MIVYIKKDLQNDHTSQHASADEGILQSPSPG